MKTPVLLGALDFLDPKRTPDRAGMDDDMARMHDSAAQCAGQVWRAWKFFHYRRCLDWGTQPSMVCAKLLGFPSPMFRDKHSPRWWTEFRKFIDNHVTRVRCRAAYDISKKMKSKLEDGAKRWAMLVRRSASAYME